MVLAVSTTAATIQRMLAGCATTEGPAVAGAVSMIISCLAVDRIDERRS